MVRLLLGVRGESLRHPAYLAPSRFQYALSRLIAFGIVSSRRDTIKPLPNAWLSFTSDQNGSEKTVLAVILFFLPWLLAISFLPVGAFPLSGLAAIPLLGVGEILWHVTIPATSAVITLMKSAGIAKTVHPRRIQSLAQQSVLLGLCLFTLRYGGMMGRAAAAAWIGVLAVNAAAAVVLFLWRARVDELDSRLRRCLGA